MARPMDGRMSSGGWTATSSATAEPSAATRIVAAMEDEHSAAVAYTFAARTVGPGIGGRTERQQHSVVGCCGSVCIEIHASILGLQGGGVHVFALLPARRASQLLLRAHGVEHGSAECGEDNLRLEACPCSLHLQD
jgi:hypothetical protein